MTWKKIDHGNKFVACSMEARAGAPLGTIPILRQKGWVGSEKWQFLLTFSTVLTLKQWVGGSKKVQKYDDVIKGRSLTLLYS